MGVGLAGYVEDVPSGVNDILFRCGLAADDPPLVNRPLDDLRNQIFSFYWI